MTSIKVLDCTFRDGGYYTNWHFDSDLARRYLNAIDSSGVDYAELGYRSFEHDDFFGIFKYSRDNYLHQLRKGIKTKFAVMIDAKELMSCGQPIVKAVNELFASKSESPVDMVRTAITIEQVEPAIEICGILKELGYETTINLMQISLLSDDDRVSIFEKIGQSGVVDVLYFADSFGSMLPSEIPRLVSALRLTAGIPIGVHCHNNLGLAVANTVAAIEAGAVFVDATLLGMGRGAGNAETEFLLLFLQRLYGGTSKRVPEALFELALSDFETMKNTYGWGPSLPYKLSALYQIHPTYCQQMLSQRRYTPQQVVSTLRVLGNTSTATRFSTSQLADAINLTFTNSSLPPPTILELPFEHIPVAECALIVGSGPSVLDHRNAILQFIEKHHPLVLTCNYNPQIPPHCEPYIFALNLERIQRDRNIMEDVQYRKIVPKSRMQGAISPNIAITSAYSYECEVKPGTLEAKANGCIIPADVVSHYAIAFASRYVSRAIYLAGFDGYPGDTSSERALNREMDDFFALYQNNENNPMLISLTPTVYHVHRDNVYFYL